MDSATTIKRPSVECEHCDGELIKLRKRVCSNGAIQFCWHCQRCGSRKGTTVPKKAVLALNRGMPPDVDDSIRQRWYEHLSQVRDAEYDAKRAKEKAEFDAWYSGYLQSTEWKLKRQKVLRRCRNICEGCMQARANVVHHLTYEHVGNELLFELVGLCEACHDKAHAQQSQEEQAA